MNIACNRFKSFIQQWFWPVCCGLLLGLLLTSILRQSPSGNPFAFRSIVNSYAAAVNRASPTVVNIYSRKRSASINGNQAPDSFYNKAPQQQRQQSLGSGVIISEQGYILTNHHVIKDADEILVFLADGRESLAKLVGTDPDTDLAVLHIGLEKLRAIPIADSNKLRVGDIVLAIGNPYGFEQTVTQGIVSALGRYGLQINTYENFIQTDAAINPGNSGGALIDIHGNLVGINSAIFSRSGGSQGIGLATPSHTAIKVLNDIIQYGHVVRGWLGIEVRQVPETYATRLGLDDTSANGVLVTNTVPHGPADQAGILPGDILIAIDGKLIKDGHSGMQQTASVVPGTTVALSLIRDGKRIIANTLVGTRPYRSE